MDFVGAIKAGFKNYATFTGVASRSEYWYWVLFTFTVNLVTSMFDAVVFKTADPNSPGIGLLQPLWTLAIFIPSLSIQVRRLRDSGHSWKWLLTPYIGGLIFIVGSIMLVVALFSSSAGVNFLSDNYDPSYISDQLFSELASNAVFLSSLVLILVGGLVFLVFEIIILVYTIEGTKTFEQGNKYVAASNPINPVNPIN